MSRILVVFALLAALSGPAAAATVTIDLPDVDRATRESARYRCGDAEVRVLYVNAGENALAVLSFGARTVIAAATLSASGARYAGQELVWWTKGDDATLYDLTKGEDAPGIDCTLSG